MRSDRLYLTDMVDAAQAIAGFITEMDPAQFYQDGKTQSAVVQKLIVIGEAAARLSGDLKTRYSTIEWRDIVAFRNILVHAYFSIQLEIIWETATQDVPTLESQIVDILIQEFGE